jgi:hypothetical protein
MNFQATKLRRRYLLAAIFTLTTCGIAQAGPAGRPSPRPSPKAEDPKRPEPGKIRPEGPEAIREEHLKEKAFVQDALGLEPDPSRSLLEAERTPFPFWKGEVSRRANSLNIPAAAVAAAPTSLR